MKWLPKIGKSSLSLFPHLTIIGPTLKLRFKEHPRTTTKVNKIRNFIKFYVKFVYGTTSRPGIHVNNIRKFHEIGGFQNRGYTICSSVRNLKITNNCKLFELMTAIIMGIRISSWASGEFHRNDDQITSLFNKMLQWTCHHSYQYVYALVFMNFNIFLKHEINTVITCVLKLL